ncbi:DUF6603 domain-containing protein [Spongiimicrobium salis]|uniref:DUF6603 domain-containing protein n=1 Tax=Spongiimicrobium salis TaxID=1667022 RepID=UPI00374DB85E
MPQDALQSILTEAGLAIAPIRSIDSPQKAVAFFRKLGYELPEGAFGTALSDLATEVTELVTGIQNLVAATEDEEIVVALAEVLVRFGTTVNAIVQLNEQIKSNGNAGIPNINDLPRRLTDFLLLEYFEVQKPQLHDTLFLLGLVEREPEAGPGQPSRSILWDRFGVLFTDPRQIFNEVYQWETDFDADKFLFRLERLMKSSGLPGGLYPQAETTKALLGNTIANQKELRFPFFQKGFTAETYAQFGVTFSPVDAQGPQKRGIALLPYLMGAAEFQFDVCDKGELLFESTADIKGIGLVLRPPFQAEGILGLTANYLATIQIREKPEKSEELILVGSREGTRLSLKGLGVKWFIGNAGGNLDLGIEGEIQVIRLVIKGGDGDGFLQQILSGVNVQIDSHLAFKISLLHGFSISGGSQFNIHIPTHIELGPLAIEGLTLGLSPGAEQFDLNVGANMKVTLGPFVGVVENIGLKAALEFEQGNLGVANLDVGFKPPTGIGLSLDTGIVKGGGYLFFDPDNERYGGALELEIQGTLLVTAIGLITTRMPDGSKGFSLLLMINVQFTPGIVLGMGFFLSGLGGLIGIHRTVEVEVLRQGVRQGGIDHIMFPEDVVENISRIITDLRAIFPPKEDQFIIGLMAKITWSVPTLISIEFGLLVEFANPVRIAILGVIKAVIPTEEAAILKLQVNFLGVIDFEKGELSFDASLEGSRILTFTLEGDMALRLSWGEKKAFVLSVGGFHPSFNPPAHLNLGVMKRLTLSILSGNPSLVLTSYFAITSNTVQFGAAIDFSFRISKFSIIGYFGFDVLFQFSPFRFIAGIRAGIEVKLGSSTLFSITLDFELQGPTPWVASGTASFKVLFIKIKVRFNETWGERREVMEATIPILPKILDALTEASNWSAIITTNKNLLVSLKEAEMEEGALLMQSMGSLQINQTIVPLDLLISKYGNHRPEDIKRVNISQVRIGGSIMEIEKVKDTFVPAGYKEMEDQDKLSSPSYVEEDSGVRTKSTDALHMNYAINRPVNYEQRVSDYDRESETPYALYSPYSLDTWEDDALMFRNMAKGGAVGKSPLSIQLREKKEGHLAKVSLEDPPFSIMNTYDLQKIQLPHFDRGSQSEADQALKELLVAQPALRGKLQVVPLDELEEVL